MFIKLNEVQKEQTIRIFAHGVQEATIHICKILSTGRNLFTRAGTEVNLGKAVRRRRRCIKVVNLALKGYIR